MFNICVNIILVVLVIGIIHKRWFNFVTSIKGWLNDIKEDPDSGYIMPFAVVVMICIITTVLLVIHMIMQLGVISTFILTFIIVYDKVPTHFGNAWGKFSNKFKSFMDSIESKFKRFMDSIESKGRD